MLLSKRPKTQVAAMIGDLPFFLFVFTPLRGAKAGMISNTSDEADSSETRNCMELLRRMGMLSWQLICDVMCEIYVKYIEQ